MNQSQKQWLRAKAAFEAVMLRAGGVKVEDNHFEKYHVATTCGTLAVSLSEGLGFVAAKFLTDPHKSGGFRDLPIGDGLNTFSWKWNCHAFKGKKSDILAAIEIFEGRLRKILPQVETMKTTKAQHTGGKMEVLTPRHGYPVIRTEDGVGVFKTDLSISGGSWVESIAEAQANAAELVRRWNCHKELLAALERLLAAARHCSAQHGGDFDRLWECDATLAKSAIAKARGEA